MANNALKPRKLPTRRCTACGEHFPKNELVRVIRTPTGEITLDVTGKAAGRGAYICRRRECFAKARKQKRLEASLECRIPDAVYDELEKELDGGEG